MLQSEVNSGSRESAGIPGVVSASGMDHDVHRLPLGDQ
jgi:hypothetical protein